MIKHKNAKRSFSLIMIILLMVTSFSAQSRATKAYNDEQNADNQEVVFDVTEDHLDIEVDEVINVSETTIIEDDSDEIQTPVANETEPISEAETDDLESIDLTETESTEATIPKEQIDETKPETNEQLDVMEELSPSNPDNLPEGYVSKFGVTIPAGYPLVRFAKNSKSNYRLNSTDLEPGEVRLYKTATPKEGLVNTWDITLRVEGRDSETTTDVVLVIDRSGSMGGRSGRIEAAKDAANKFVDTILKDDEARGLNRIAVVSFASDVSADINLTNNVANLKSSINGLSAVGGTHTQAGIHLARQVLDNVPEDDRADNQYIIVLSDGEPTYSYALNSGEINNTENFTDFSDGRRFTKDDLSEDKFNYNERVGTGSSIRQQIGGWNSVFYYHNGNSAIAESRFAKAAGYSLYSIGLGVVESGRGVLQNIATGNQYYDAGTDDLTSVFQEIAGQIDSAIKVASVNDPMGLGFQVVGTVTDVKVSEGDVSLSTDKKTIDWEIGIPTKFISEESDIRFAELTYTVEINDDILDAQSIDEVLYNTNGDAKISYIDIKNESKTKYFPKPTVNPVLYKVTKEVQHADGTKVTTQPDKEFTINIKGNNFESDYTLNPNVNGSTGYLTDLRPETTYTIEELEVSSEYDVVYFVNGIETNEFTILDDTTPDVHILVANRLRSTQVDVEKIWKDANNQDGIRPASVTITLVANDEATLQTLELNEDNNWQGSFVELDEYAAGELIEYTVSEQEVPAGYQVAVTGSSSEGYTVTNTHIPETIKVAGSKTWDDSDNQDGKRPTSITINLLADGEQVDSKEVKADDWSWSFEDLPKYAAGKLITYTITEEAVDEYTTTIEGYNVTNTHIPETIKVAGSKTWDDSDNQDGKRPTSITINLLADGEQVDSKEVKADDWSWSFEELPKYAAGKLITYTITEEAVDEYTTTIEGYNVTNTHIPETIKVAGRKTWDDSDNQDGKRPTSITINLLADGEQVDSKEVKADDWSWSFEELPKYKDGIEITYTLSEVSVTDYSTVINGYDVTNSYTPGKVSIQVTKAWEDANNQDGIRPASVTITLVANDEATLQTLELNEDNNWQGSFVELDEYAAGELIEYTVSEQEVPAGYQVAVTGSSSEGYTVTNTHIPETIKVAGSKTWDDSDNQDGKRPTSITINLLADGEQVDSKEVKADDWSWSFEELPKYKDGIEITYTLSEVSVTDYSTVINGYDVTNSYTPGKVSIQVTKAWEDANNQDGIRPASVTITLVANDEATLQTLELNEDNNWQGSFVELDEYAAGELIEYTVSEQEVPAGYQVAVTGSSSEGYTVTNTHIPETIKVAGSKTWDDSDNQDGKRPTSITINLLADGEQVDSKEVKADDWSWSFEELPKYAAGKLITYTITEEAVDEYTTTIEGYNVTNTHIPETIKVAGRKTWDDSDNQDGKRPTSITINLLADGEQVDSKEVKADDWSWSFEELPKYKDGIEITYTLSEVSVTDYSTVINGYDVTNSYTPGKVSIQVTKAWEDANNQDGIRPASVTITLVANGEATLQTLELNEDNNWQGSFVELDEYAAGELIEYTVSEQEVPAGYQVAVTGSSSEGYIVQNTYSPEVTEIEVIKIWIDKDDAQKLRPKTITIRLWDGDLEIASKVVNANDEWKWTIDQLPKYNDGVEIQYTITEDPVKDYKTTIDGYTVTNELITPLPETGTQSTKPLVTIGLIGLGLYLVLRKKEDL